MCFNSENCYNKLSSDKKTPLEGVVFKVTTATGEFVPDEGGKISSNGLYYTDENGQIIINGITGTLVVTEVETIPGYTIDEATRTQTVVVNPDDTQSLYFYNDPIGGVEIIKVNAADTSKRIPIRSVRSAFTTHMFKEELQCLYAKQTEARNTLQADAHIQMQKLIYQMEHGEIRNEKVEKLITELSERLQETSGRKVYGYLPPRVKRIVDEIVDELAKDERVAKAYDLWQQMRDEVCRSYSNTPPERLPLSQQKEFKAIRNMVIREALNLSAVSNGYEDGYLSDTPQEDDEPEQQRVADDIHEETKYGYTVYEQARLYRRAKRVLEDEASGITEVLEARDLLETLWEEGYTVAAHQLGKLHRDGISTIPNKDTAAMWFRRSAEAGNDFSQYALGKLLLEEQDKQEAVRWLEKAAEAGNQHARYRVGKLYLEGALVKKDVAKAIEYLTASAKQGNQYAQYTLGKLYLLGKDVKQDKGTAIEWLTQSAQQGNPYAKFFLTRIDNPYGTDAWVAALRMMHHMGNIFRDNTDRGGAYINLLQIDRKRRKELQRKRKALGHHVKDHEEHAPMQQVM